MTPWRTGLLVLLCAAVGCGDDAGEDYPTNPGGNDTTGDDGDAVVADAAVDAEPDAEPDAPPDAEPDARLPPDAPPPPNRTGRVCLVADLQDVFLPTLCLPNGVLDTTVELDGNTTLTTEDGSFTVAGTFDTTALWHVTRADLVSTTMAQSTSNTLYAVRQTTYDQAIATAAAPNFGAGEGAVVLRLVTGAQEVEGAKVTSMTATITPRYDAGTSTWVAGAAETTGELGLVWISVVAAGNLSLFVTEADSTVTAVTVPVEAGKVTYRQVSL